MRAQAAGKQAVAIGNLHHVVLADVGAVHAARHQLRPAVDIPAGIADHGRLAGGAAAGMDAHNFTLGNGKQAERIVVAQILLFGKRQ